MDASATDSTSSMLATGSPPPRPRLALTAGPGAVTASPTTRRDVARLFQHSVATEELHAARRKKYGSRSANVQDRPEASMSVNALAFDRTPLEKALFRRHMGTPVLVTAKIGGKR